MIESTEDFTLLDLAGEAEQRADQPSFHVFSEAQVRGQVFRLGPGETLGELAYDGAVLVTGVSGELELEVAGLRRSFGPLCQVLVNRGVRFTLEARGPAAVQLVWSPPFEQVTTPSAS
jgi:hypothetical protein